jgi:hypothetical protein
MRHAVAMEDRTILQHISDLVDEEHRLRSDAAGLDDEGRARLRSVEVELDQCWDLLRQRRAREEIGKDPDDARARPEGTVEGYLQ